MNTLPQLGDGPFASKVPWDKCAEQWHPHNSNWPVSKPQHNPNKTPRMFSVSTMQMQNTCTIRQTAQLEGSSKKTRSICKRSGDHQTIPWVVFFFLRALSLRVRDTSVASSHDLSGVFSVSVCVGRFSRTRPNVQNELRT